MQDTVFEQSFEVCHVHDGLNMSIARLSWFLTELEDEGERFLVEPHHANQRVSSRPGANGVATLTIRPAAGSPGITT
jgi:hypothetical protein